MNCQFDEMLLYEYLDDLLENEEKLQVERHLSACPSCRKKLSEIKLLFYELDNMDQVALPDEVSQIREAVLKDAFADRKVPLSEKLSDTKKVLEETPVIKNVIPNRENLSKAAKGIYKGSKKVIDKMPKKKEKTPKPKRSLGGLL